jgi:hypothetical protein
LAEHAVASPPPYEGDTDWEWDDRYQYFADFEDGTLGYFDREPKRWKFKAASNYNNNLKRQKPIRGDEVRSQKLTGEQQDNGTTKRRHTSPTPTVLWRSQDARRRKEPDLPAVEKDSVPLFKGFKERLEAISSPFIRHKGSEINERGEEHQQSNNSNISSSDRSPIIGEGVEHKKIQTPTITREALAAALQSRLGDSSTLQFGEQSKILEYAMRMLQSEDDADDIVGELAEDILAQDEDQVSLAEDSESKMPAWLLAQKALLATGTRPDTTAILPDTFKNQVADSMEGAAIRGIKVHHPQPMTTPSKKRPRNDSTEIQNMHGDVDADGPKAKRPAVSFAVSTASSKARSIPTNTGIRGKRE